METVWIYDTTLRDGAQKEGLSLSVDDKIKIARRLDELGVHYIEGGWPGSNPKDIQFFQSMKKEPLKNAKLAAFGSTRRKGVDAEKDLGLEQLLEAETPVITLVGKSWDLHVDEVLRATRDENLAMISDSIAHLVSHGREVHFDAEHFFDGYQANADYALKTLVAAAQGGAEFLVLCDTNGGTLPGAVGRVVKEVETKLVESGWENLKLGMHAHNDGDCAVANSLAAIEAGCSQVQGTTNGYGERCGNANLMCIIPSLMLKMKRAAISDKQLATLTEAAHFVADIANVNLPSSSPFVGESAFAHKGGLHVDGVMKADGSFEHIAPSSVGNEQRVVVSELSGKSTIAIKARDIGLEQAEDPEWIGAMLRMVKDLEHKGYHFEAADASFELLMLREAGKFDPSFALESYRVVMEEFGREWQPTTGLSAAHVSSIQTEAVVKLHVGGERVIAMAEGNGPVNALDQGLRRALEQAYPLIHGIKLTDYKVRALADSAGTGSVVRVLIESSDGDKTWGTVGVSENIIEASWNALVDSIEYGLLRINGADK